MKAGFFLANKPKGISSFSFLRSIKLDALLNSETQSREPGEAGKELSKLKKGYAGTLDPFATGLMMGAFGEATQFLDLFHLFSKTYQARMCLGKTSPSLDPDTAISEIKAWKPGLIKPRQVEDILKEFLGTGVQTAPAYSAKKIQGQRAYDLVRAGKTPLIQAHSICVEGLKLLGWQEFEDEAYLDFEVSCSSGTYVRTLAQDMAARLGSIAYLLELKRTRIGPFCVPEQEIQILTLDQVLGGLEFPQVFKYRVLLNEFEKKLVSHGALPYRHAQAIRDAVRMGSEDPKGFLLEYRHLDELIKWEYLPARHKKMIAQ